MAEQSDAQSTPNSDIASLPNSGRDVQEGVAPLTPEQQVTQLSNYFEDNYPEIFASLTQDQGAPYRESGTPVPQELKDATERHWARTVDLITHTSLLVLGAGLDHRMPQNAYLSAGEVAADSEPEFAAQLPDGVRATVLSPRNRASNGAVAISVHGGPGWCGDGVSHDQFWLPLFGAIAARSGVTVVDITYPLPGYGPWGETQDAVLRAGEVVRQWAQGRPLGSIVFGTGLIAAKKVVESSDFVVALSPRIVEEVAMELPEIPLLVSVGELDTRGTSTSDCQGWAEATGAELTFQSWPSEHVLAAPTVWRERVDAVADWLSGLPHDE